MTASLLNEISSSCGMAPLHLAVATSRFDIASLLMDRAADVNVRDAQQRTPLHFAALTPNARLVGALAYHSMRAGLARANPKPSWSKVQELLGRRADPFCATELGTGEGGSCHCLSLSDSTSGRGQFTLVIVVYIR